MYIEVMVDKKIFFLYKKIKKNYIFFQPERVETYIQTIKNIDSKLYKSYTEYATEKEPDFFINYLDFNYKKEENKKIYISDKQIPTFLKKELLTNAFTHLKSSQELFRDLIVFEIKQYIKKKPFIKIKNEIKDEILKYYKLLDSEVLEYLEQRIEMLKKRDLC